MDAFRVDAQFMAAHEVAHDLSDITSRLARVVFTLKGGSCRGGWIFGGVKIEWRAHSLPNRQYQLTITITNGAKLKLAGKTLFAVPKDGGEPIKLAKFRRDSGLSLTKKNLALGEYKFNIA